MRAGRDDRIAMMEEFGEQRVVVIAGPTAGGKTALGVDLALALDGEVVSADSMQVYRYMDIGTAKPGLDEQALVPHHLIDIIDPHEQYDAARFVRDALNAIQEIADRHRIVLLTGGTGLYLKALVDGLFATLPTNDKIRGELQARIDAGERAKLYTELCAIDPESGARIHANDTQRLVRGLEIYLASGSTWTNLLNQQKREGQGVRFTNIYQIALTCEREQLYRRIEQRSEIMVQSGLIEEVEQLRNRGYSENLSSMQSIGYRHANSFLSGTYDDKTMMTELVRDTRRYAKRQMTWFRKNEQLHWVDRSDTGRVADHVAKHLSL